MMGKMDEQIIVVERAALFGGGNTPDLTFQGLERSPGKIAELEQRMAEHYQVMRRGDAEENPDYKQPIPYAVIRRGDGYFAYKRLGGGGEARLHGRLSIGVGGHMNAAGQAGTFKDVLSVNLRRELNEELAISGAKGLSFRTIGLINDDAAEVGRVHIGILVAIDLPVTADVSVREKDKLEGQWLHLDQLLAEKDKLESWSGFAADALAE